MQVKVNCTKCTLEVFQDVDPTVSTNYIYCPGCDNVFEYSSNSNINHTNTVVDNENNEQNDPVYQNLMKAYEEIPHTLIKSDSIFLKGFINGTEIQFLLDTGAEMSVLPLNIVEACYVEVVLDCGVYPCAFTVCSNNDVPPILGIDMMYNLGIGIDFKNKKIHFGPHCSVDFISKKHSCVI